MNVNNLKPAWRQFKLLNSIQRVHEEELLLMIESAEGESIFTLQRILIYAVTFIIFTFSFQGG